MAKLRWELATIEWHYANPAHLGFSRAAEDVRAPVWMAINAASTAWSLGEWAHAAVAAHPARLRALCERVGATPASSFNQIKPFLRNTYEIDVCYQISHAAKHAVLWDITEGLCTSTSFSIYGEGDSLFISEGGLVEKKEGEWTYKSTIVSVLADAERWWISASGDLGL